MNNFELDDGGRADAGYQGTTGDCFVRSASIATGMGYQSLYDLTIRYAAKERETKRKRKIKNWRSHPRTGVYSATARRVMDGLGWTWIATMGIGTGCKVHLLASELPSGSILVRCSKHFTAMIDGVIHDTHDPSREGTRCVYGYYKKDKETA